MPRRLWLSLALLATGGALLGSARLAAASPPTPGIFRVGIPGASVQIDPQLSYVTTGWWLEYATAAKLYNWSDRGSRLVPEVASSAAISNGGRTYTFFLRKGFRFSDGKLVTAKSFAYAIDRVANKDLASPGAAFITDPSGTNIVGAAAVNAGRATHVSGVKVKGAYKLVIRLTKPDTTFLSKLAMPFFQATSTTLPLTREVVDGYPSAGPYALTHNEANVLTSIRRNAYYKRGSGRVRQQSIAGLDVQWNLNEEDAFQQVEANQLDEGPVPAAEVQSVARRYGVNKTRFWVMPSNCIGFLAFNNRLPLFGHSAPLRKAVNWAVDRTAYAGQAGPFAATPWTHLLPPLFPGSITKKRLQPYAAHANIARARKLAGRYVQNRKIKVAYRSSGIGQAQADLVRNALIQLGFKPENITMKAFSGGDIYTAMGAHGSDLDMGVSIGYCAEYPDSYGVLSFFLDRSSGVAVDKYRRKLAATRKVGTNARLKALGRLDLEITRNLAPAAVMRTYNNRYFFSDRVNPRSLAYSRIYQDWSIPALALK